MVVRLEHYGTGADYDFNNDWDYLDQIHHPEKCEILINALCNPKCPFRKEHYIQASKVQKGLLKLDDISPDDKIAHCKAQTRTMDKIKKLPTFITREDIFEKYVPKGFRHFKIERRCGSPLVSGEWYLYYMVKPEYQDEERAWLHMAAETTMLSPNIPPLID